MRLTIVDTFFCISLPAETILNPFKVIRPDGEGVRASAATVIATSDCGLTIVDIFFRISFSVDTSVVLMFLKAIIFDVTEGGNAENYGLYNTNSVQINDFLDQQWFRLFFGSTVVCVCQRLCVYVKTV